MCCRLSTALAQTASDLEQQQSQVEDEAVATAEEAAEQAQQQQPPQQLDAKTLEDIRQRIESRQAQRAAKVGPANPLDTRLWTGGPGR